MADDPYREADGGQVAEQGLQISQDHTPSRNSVNYGKVLVIKTGGRYAHLPEKEGAY